MKVILKNSTLVFEKALEKVSIQSYDSFGGQMGSSGYINQVNASAEDKRVQLYNVSEFAGKKLHVTVYFNISPSNPTDPTIISFSTSAVTHEDAVDDVLTMNRGKYTSTHAGLTREWGIEGKPTACCKISGEIDIPVNAVAMALCAGQYAYTEVSYPDNSEAYYYE